MNFGDNMKWDIDDNPDNLLPNYEESDLSKFVYNLNDEKMTTEMTVQEEKARTIVDKIFILLENYRDNKHEVLTEIKNLIVSLEEKIQLIEEYIKKINQLEDVDEETIEHIQVKTNEYLQLIKKTKNTINILINLKKAINKNDDKEIEKLKQELDYRRSFLYTIGEYSLMTLSYGGTMLNLIIEKIDEIMKNELNQPETDSHRHGSYKPNIAGEFTSKKGSETLDYLYKEISNFYNYKILRKEKKDYYRNYLNLHGTTKIPQIKNKEMSDNSMRPSPLNALGHKPSVCKNRENILKKSRTDDVFSYRPSGTSIMGLVLGGLTIAGGYFVIKKLIRKKHVHRRKK